MPGGFHSSTNHPTEVRVGGVWIRVGRQKMDAAIVVASDGLRAECRVMGDVKEGERVVVGEDGVRLLEVRGAREAGAAFGFMSSVVSSEKPTAGLTDRVARVILEAKSAGEKICVVAGPAVVHTGAQGALARLIRRGVVDVLLGGNALAAHDIEHQLYGTSLGCGQDGGAHPNGHRHHLYAINEVRSAGSIAALIRARRLRGGILYEATKRGIPVVLAGSIRDDGPLPEVVTDVLESQRRMRDALEGVGVTLMLATLLHSIAVGNLLGSHVRTVCVDINPSAVTKLADRGTAHAVGIVTDVGTWLPALEAALARVRRGRR